LTAVATQARTSARSSPDIVRVVPARVGLVGNPSDGFGGAVLATVVSGLVATVSAAPAPGVSFEGPGVAAHWSSMQAFLGHVDHSGHGDEQRIISAADAP